MWKIPFPDHCFPKISKYLTKNLHFPSTSKYYAPHLCLHLSWKWLLMQFILSVVLERPVRFVTTVDVVLEEYKNCLPNNIWLGAKHVLIVFGQACVKGALSMISSTSNKTVCSSSKWLQKKKKWVQKIGRPIPGLLNPLLKMVQKLSNLLSNLQR